MLDPKNIIFQINNKKKKTCKKCESTEKKKCEPNNIEYFIKHNRHHLHKYFTSVGK